MTYSYSIDVKHKLTSIVTLKTDYDKAPYVVIGYSIREAQVKYILKSGDFEGEFLQCEIDDNDIKYSAN